MKIITRIKEYRAKNNITQENLANLVGVRICLRRTLPMP